MTLAVHPLVLTLFFPLVGFLALLLLKEGQKSALRWVTLIASLVTFGLSIWVTVLFLQNGKPLDMDLPWLAFGDLEVRLHLGADGLSIAMLLLTTFLTPLALLSTWTAVQDRVKGFMMFFLLLEMGMMGVFLALDLVLFYIFWEFTLIPMLFLIGVWGGERRIYAAVKFFLFTMAGSVLMLLAIIFIGFQARTFSLPELVGMREVFAGSQMLLFAAFGIAFAIKVPMWPLHSWLPDAHVEAPTAGSVILAGVLLKMGAYGFLRFNLPLFPEATRTLAPWMAGLAVIGILYGAIVAFRQTDVKKLVAYSSVSHLGFVMLGIFSLTPQGISGAIIQMVNHGLSTGALFLVVGYLYERRHTRQLDAFGGIWKVMPFLGALGLIVTLSSAGLPGLNGFVGEFTILVGSFSSPALGSGWFAGISALGVILAAVYLFFMFEKVFLGPVKHAENAALKDLTFRETLVLAPIIALIFAIGLFPQPVFDLIQPSVDGLVQVVQSAMLALH